jgi:hypothetical protein
MHGTTPLTRWEWLLLLGGLLLFALQAGLASPQKSAAFDEEYHLAAGYAYLKTGDFRLSLSHPPLIDTLTAVPLLLRDDVVLPLEHPSWGNRDYFQFSDVFLWQANRDNAHTLLIWSRWPIIALGVLLTAVLFFWARALINPLGGWVVFALAIFDPNLLANARLTTTDLGLAVFITLTMWQLWRWLDLPPSAKPLNRWGTFALVGLLAGLTMTTKFTGGLIWPMIGFSLLLYPGYAHRRWLALLAWLGLGYLALTAVYRFDFGWIPGYDWLPPLFAPFYPYSLLDTLFVIEEQPKPAYLFGEISQRGWWYYFPVALAVKTPLPTLILTALGLWPLVRHGAWRRHVVIWAPLFLYLALAMTGRITIGYRHVLPVVPFLILTAGFATHWLEKLATRFNPQWGYAGLATLLLWSAVGTLWLFPHHEAFFNELVGGPANGGQVLSDSNLDWGQDLPALKQLLAEREIEQVNLAYFGTAVPEAYGLSYKPLPSFIRFTAGAEVDAFNPYTPAPGWYAISESSLRFGLMMQNNDLYAYFAEQEPVARAGYSINLYEVSYPEDWPTRTTAVSGVSVADLSPEELGITAESRTIVKWTSDNQTEIMLPESFDPPANFRPITEATFGSDAFSLIGFTLDPPQVTAVEPLTLTLYWQVGTGRVPTPTPSQAAPLAAFVHLSATDDPAQIVAQYDGWNTALTGLEPGDVIAHTITLIPPADTPFGSYTLRVGLYSPQSGQRLRLPDGATYVDLAP